MFQVALSQVQGRTFACKKTLPIIQSLDPSKGAEAAIFKGLIFVHLYGVYEYAVNSAVQCALSYVASGSMSPKDLHLSLLTLVLDSEFKAVADSGKTRTWSKRIALVQKLDDPNILSNLNNTNFPSDGSHYRIQQLHTLWLIFGVDKPIVPESRLIGRVDELVDNRNAIAHGRRTPEDVGSRYTVGDISRIIVDVEEISTYVLETMQRHCIEGGLYRIPNIQHSSGEST